jgi:hypothetical protein
MNKVNGIDEGGQLRWLIAAWSVTGLILFSATWPLWWNSDSIFPAVPFVGGISAPRFEAGLTIGLLASLLIVLISSICKYSQWTRRASVLFVLCDAVSVLFNQHRLQPWMYHFLILGAVGALACNRADQSSDVESQSDNDSVDESSPTFRNLLSTHAGLLLVVTSSIYIWSGWSKLDYSFANSYGQLFVDTLVEPLGFRTHLWSDSARQVTALALPLGEVLAGVLILLRRTRNIGFGLSLMMHVSLLMIVGPLGLRHENGVLIWNIFFIVQNVFLWRILPKGSAQPTTSRRARVLVILVVVLPSLRMFGSLDNWPAWAVYASNSARVHVLIDTTTVESDFPMYYLEPRRVQTTYEYFRIDRWSIVSSNAPVYPQDRYYVAICLRLYETNPNLKMEFVWESASNRWTGKRTQHVLRTKDELLEFSNRYWLGTTAR